MRWWHRTRGLVRNLLFRGRADRELDEELDAYRTLVADANARPERGAARQPAGTAEFDGLSRAREAVRSARPGGGLERVWQDLRHAVRGLWRQPGHAALAIVLLTLGIGATTGIFSVTDAVLLRPLPYTHPEQLVEIVSIIQKGTPEERRQVATTWADLDGWRRHPEVFSALATFGFPRPTTIAEVSGEAANVGWLSPEILSALGAQPLVGRGFSTGDVTSAAPVALLGEVLWRGAFGADQAVLGRTITIDGRPYGVVGVVPKTVIPRVVASTRVVWLPFDESAARSMGRQILPGLVARLRPGLSIDRAVPIANAAFHEFRPDRPGAPTWNVGLEPLDRYVRASGDWRRVLILLLGSVAFVLLIACANVANLILARLLNRRREMAVRGALGATPARLVRLVLAEGVAVAAVSTLAGGALAALIITAAPSVIPGAADLFRINLPAFDVRTFACCAAAGVATTLICGLIPGWRAATVNLVEAFEGSSRIAGLAPAGRRLQRGLQVAQIALTLILLTGAGLLTASYARMLGTESGYDQDHLFAVRIVLPPERYPTDAARAERFDTIRQQVNTIPGVRAAYGDAPSKAFIEGFFAQDQDNAAVPFHSVTRYEAGVDYFATVGIPLRQGRTFVPSDWNGGEPVAIIDERAAELYWPGTSPLGRRFRFGPFPEQPWTTVVGVVGHVTSKLFASQTGRLIGPAQAYVPLSDRGSGRDLLVSARGGEAALSGAIRERLRRLDPALAPESVQAVAGMYEEAFRGPRFVLGLMSLLAAMAVITAAAGLYGILNYTVNRRRHELGVRMALGATAGPLSRLVIRDALAPVAVGGLVGLVGSWWLSRYLQQLLYGVTPHDPVTFAVVLVVMLIVAGLAVLPPLRRAIRLDPIATLRAE
jgi:putative ABC transport system permease protein